MSHRKDRLAHVVRDIVSDAILNRVSDPRVNELTSVTRVELSADLKVATVYVSVMGTDIDARTTMRGLQSARGMIQTRLARRLNIRQCPSIRFHLDEGIKRAIEIFQKIDTVEMDSSISDPAETEGNERPIESPDTQAESSSSGYEEKS